MSHDPRDILQRLRNPTSPLSADELVNLRNSAAHEIERLRNLLNAREQEIGTECVTSPSGYHEWHLFPADKDGNRVTHMRYNGGPLHAVSVCRWCDGVSQPFGPVHDAH